MFGFFIHAFSNPGVVAAFAIVCLFGVFIGEIDIRNREIRVLHGEKDALMNDIKRLRDECDEVRAERDAAEEKCDELEDEIEGDERLKAAREELEDAHEERRKDSERFDDQVRQKNEILMVISVFGMVTLLLGAMISLVVILRPTEVGCAAKVYSHY
jgi:ElaB/YqjD/DUF883 family membrane-anchored ribosome-binding protein